MKILYSRRKYYIELWSRYKTLIILYVFFLFCWIVLAIISTPIRLNEEFFTSWFVNFSEDLLFFGTSILSLVLGSRLARDEDFGTRVGALTNGRYAHQEAERFLRLKVEELMTYTKAYQLSIILKKFDRSKKHVYVHITSESTLVNMCEDKELFYFITAKVEPGPPVDGSHGFVTHHSFSTDRINSNPYFLIPEGHTKNLTEEPDNVYVKTRRVPLCGDGSGKLKLCYEIWIPLSADKSDGNDWYYHQFPVYTEKADIYIKNEIKDVNINYIAKYIDRKMSDPVNTENILSNGIIYADNTEKPVASDLVFHTNDKFEASFSIS
jgi:hypothetical protein